MKRLLISAGLILAATSKQAAVQSHWDRPSCYIYVHGQCFPPGGEVKCDQESYDWGLGQCDGYYPSNARVDAPRPGSFGTPSKKVLQSTRALILKSFD